MSRHAAGSLMAAGCGLAWGAVSIIVRELDMPALAIVFFRVALGAAAIALILVLLGRRELFRLPSRAPLAIGVLLAVHWGFFFTAIKETSVASAALVTYTAPVFVALVAPLALGEDVPRRSVAALAASLGGIALIVTAGGGEDGVRAPGVGLAVLAALSMAALIVLSKRVVADIDPLTIVLYDQLTAAVILSPALVAGGYALDAEAVAYLVVLGVVLTGGATAVYVSALRHVPATTGGILLYLEPLSAALLASLLLGEELTPAIAVGGALIVAGGVAVARAVPAGSEGGAAVEAAVADRVPAR